MTDCKHEWTVKFNEDNAEWCNHCGALLIGSGPGRYWHEAMNNREAKP